MKRTLPSLVLLSGVAAAALVASCGGDGSPADALPPLGIRNEALVSLVNDVMVPTCREVRRRGQELHEATAQFCAAPSTVNLQIAREAWRAARVVFKQAEAVGMGPFQEKRLDRAMDFWPVRERYIEETVAQQDTFSLSTLGALGADVKGLPALEYLLFAEAGGAGGALAALTSGPRAAARCAYAVALGEEFVFHADRLLQGWTGKGGAYGAMLANAGDGNRLYPTLHRAISRLVMMMTDTIELVRDVKLGKPLGAKSGGEPQPSQVESRYSHHAIRDAAENLRGLWNFYTGSREGKRVGLGFYDLVATFHPEAAELVRDRLAAAQAAVEAIPEPLEEAVVEHPEAVQAAVDALTELRNTVGAHLASSLGVVTYFSDNDGD